MPPTRLGQTTTPGTTSPTLFEKWVGSLTCHTIWFPTRAMRRVLRFPVLIREDSKSNHLRVAALSPQCRFGWSRTLDLPHGSPMHNQLSHRCTGLRRLSVWDLKLLSPESTSISSWKPRLTFCDLVCVTCFVMIYSELWEHLWQYGPHSCAYYYHLKLRNCLSYGQSKLAKNSEVSHFSAKCPCRIKPRSI